MTANRYHKVLILLLLSYSVFSQNERFTEILNEYHLEKNFTGSVVIATNGEIDFMSSRGVANREYNIAITNSTKYKIASLSKVFTATLIMKLVEEEKLSLKSTVGDYFPEYKGEGKDRVTIHHLLTYSSGIENLLSKQGIIPYQINISLDQFIDTYCSGKLVYEPGEKAKYGNTEYILLHKIIERVTGMNYESFLSKVITHPFGLENTHVTNSSSIIPSLCSGYILDDSLNIFKKEPPYYTDLYFGSGSLYSTIEDLLNFDQALFNYQILDKETTDQMLKIYPEFGYTAYGLWGSTGWGNFQETFYYRTGSIQGFNANWIHTIKYGKTIIVLSNSNATNLYELSEKLYLESLGK